MAWNPLPHDQQCGNLMPHTLHDWKRGNATFQCRGVGHTYLSTACLHGEHDYCNSYTGAAGQKRPAECKFCGAPCRCAEPGCHRAG